MAVDANFSADLGQGAIGHKPLEARDTKKAVIRATRRPEERAQLARSYAPLAQATPLANAKRGVWKPRGTVSEARGAAPGRSPSASGLFEQLVDTPTYRSWGRKLCSVTRRDEQNTRKTVDAIRWPKAASGVREHLQLKDRFKKSLSMSGELGSLAGDRVVSHERSRPAELARRQDLRSRRAGPYPSHSCGCVSWYALLAGDHLCREAVTARDVKFD
jgi:hypothetical protein